MEEEKVKTRVIFRYWKDANEDSLCDVIAIFLDMVAYYPNQGYQVMMYEHFGQHGEGDYNGVMHQTRPARPDEYADLKKELEDRGYELTVVNRWFDRSACYNRAYREYQQSIKKGN